jgi:DivIVA domain-containing protein
MPPSDYRYRFSWDHSLMDQGDPEQRIAELEGQLAHPTAAAAPGHALTAADIRNVSFSRPPIGKRGYSEDEVDAFLDLVEKRLANPGSASLTAGDVQNMAFSKPPIGKRGYNEDEVDAFLDLVESQLRRLDGTAGPPASGQASAPQTPPITVHRFVDDGSTKRRRFSSTGIGWLSAVVVAGIYLYMCGSLAWDAYGYRVGTPATATHVSCTGDPNSDAPNVNCSGSWTVAGQTQHGPIHRVPDSWHAGQPLDVRVHGGTAFAAGSTGWYLALSTFIFAVVITMSLGGFRALNRRWRRLRSPRR